MASPGDCIGARCYAQRCSSSSDCNYTFLESASWKEHRHMATGTAECEAFILRLFPPCLDQLGLPCNVSLPLSFRRQGTYDDWPVTSVLRRSTCADVPSAALCAALHCSRELVAITRCGQGDPTDPSGPDRGGGNSFHETLIISCATPLKRSIS